MQKDVEQACLQPGWPPGTEPPRDDDVDVPLDDPMGNVASTRLGKFLKGTIT